MKKLCVFDFDNTLIPYDSFKRYLIFLLKKGSLGIWWLTVLRVCRVISSMSFKRRIYDCVEKSSKLQRLSQIFSEKVSHDVVWPQQFVDSFCSEMVNNFDVTILSASPDCYLKWLTLFIELDNIKIPVPIIGSSYFEGQFIEMYGEEKLKYIMLHFAQNRYQYYYAVSDSQTDLCWMKLFNHYEILKLQ